MGEHRRLLTAQTPIISHERACMTSLSPEVYSKKKKVVVNKGKESLET